MDNRIYAQIMNNHIVNLIGGEDVGLPTNSTLCIDITDYTDKPNKGDCYDEKNLTFMSQEEYHKKYPLMHELPFHETQQLRTVLGTLILDNINMQIQLDALILKNL